MGLDQLSASEYVRALRAGYSRLEAHKDEVNALNVFPVPDGDTGTNMSMTLRSAVAEAEKESEATLGRAAKAAARGALMGARGNSGVILSQVFRGMAKVLENKSTMTATDWAAALQSGSDTAYKAIMKPVEGTILTVVRECAQAAQGAARQGGDIAAVTGAALETARATLARTPSMLPVLREAKVVDSGGQGWVYFLEGMVVHWTGQEVEAPSLPEVSTIIPTSEEELDQEHPYCTEVLVEGAVVTREAVAAKLKPLGNSLLVIADFDLIKVHIHTANPGRVLETLLGFGSLHDIKINNMMDEIKERNARLQASASQERKTGVVAVAAGDGLAEILKSLGVDVIVEGGQTMNPSTEDLLKAVEAVPAQNVIILPNNKNIFMAAGQVGELTNKRVEVVPTANVLQCISALVGYNPDDDLDDVVECMAAERLNVTGIEITRSVRDAQVNGFAIKEGDFLGLIDDSIEVVASSMDDVIRGVLEKSFDEDKELITIFYGRDVSREEAEAVKDMAENVCPGADIELHYGGQPHYYYFIGVE